MTKCEERHPGNEERDATSKCEKGTYLCDECARFHRSMGHVVRDSGPWR